MQGSERPQARNARSSHARSRASGLHADAASAHDSPYHLSERELGVLRLLTEGLSDKQMALALGVTNYTVNKHVGAILAKMKVRSRTAAAVAAIRQHLVDDDGPISNGRRRRGGRNRSGARKPGEL